LHTRSTQEEFVGSARYSSSAASDARREHRTGFRIPALLSAGINDPSKRGDHRHRRLRLFGLRLVGESSECRRRLAPLWMSTITSWGTGYHRLIHSVLMRIRGW